MDLTNYDVNTESRSSVKPGRHVLNWIGEDEDRGIKSLLLLAQAMGLKEPPKDTSVAFMNKSVEAEIIKGKDGYLEINDDFGKTWQSVSETKDDTDDIQVSPTQKDLDEVGSNSSDDDDIPF